MQRDSRRLTRYIPCLTFVLVSSFAVAGFLPAAAFASPDGYKLVSSTGLQQVSGNAAEDEPAGAFVPQEIGPEKIGSQESALRDMREELVANGLGDLMCGEPERFAGSFADVLQSKAFEDAVCHARKNYQALAQGYVALQQAQGRGADCAAVDLRGTVIKSYGLDVSDKTGENWDQRVTVCFSDVSIWAQRGGTMYGTTFLTKHSQEEFLNRPDIGNVLLHEQRHTQQWRLLGHDFPGAYLFAGQDACSNVFEQSAGLNDGGYQC